VVPILVRLFDDTPEVRMRAPQILGIPFHILSVLTPRTFSDG